VRMLNAGMRYCEIASLLRSMRRLVGDFLGGRVGYYELVDGVVRRVESIRLVRECISYVTLLDRKILDMVDEVCRKLEDAVRSRDEVMFRKLLDELQEVVDIVMERADMLHSTVTR